MGFTLHPMISSSPGTELEGTPLLAAFLFNHGKTGFSETVELLLAHDADVDEPLGGEVHSRSLNAAYMSVVHTSLPHYAIRRKRSNQWPHPPSPDVRMGGHPDHAEAHRGRGRRQCKGSRRPYAVTPRRVRYVTPSGLELLQQWTVMLRISNRYYIYYPGFIPLTRSLLNSHYHHQCNSYAFSTPPSSSRWSPLCG